MAAAARDDKSSSSKKRSSSSSSDPVLVGLYLLMLYLCGCMILYTLLAPTPWIVERSKFHRETILPFLEDDKIGVFRVASKHLLTQYEDQATLQVTHILPPMFWSIIIPFLLHPTFPRNYPKINTFLTLVLTRMVAIMGFANFYIFYKGLTFEHFFPNIPVSGNGFSPLIAVPLTLVQTVWSITTLVESLRMSYLAGKKNNNNKRNSSSSVDNKGYYYQSSSAESQRHKFLLRHAASGLSVMVQYFIIYPLYIMYYEMTIPRPEEIPSWIQRMAFSDSIVLSILLSVGLGELAVYRYYYFYDGNNSAYYAADDDTQQQQNVKKKKKKGTTTKASSSSAVVSSSSSLKCEACGFESEFVSEGMTPCDYCCNDAVVYYCSSDCKVWHWDTHKANCDGYCPDLHHEATTTTKGASDSATELDFDDDDNDDDNKSIDVFDPAFAPEKRTTGPPGLVMNKFFL